MRRRSFGVALVVFLVSLSGSAGATEYKIDPEHTTVSFRVRHLFTSVEGRFDKFEGKISFDAADPSKAVVEGAIDAATVNTNVAERDKHLRSADFFDVANHPKITFKTTKVLEVGAGKTSGKMSGKLGVRGVEKEVVLDVAFLGQGKDPYGNLKAGFSATTRINRKDFGLVWNDTLETGGVLVGDDVEIRIDAAAYVVQ
jgi:polyisoprenoid-binding protein YceI